MKDNNICKFPLSKTSSELSISCFVLESNTETMLSRTKLNDNRLILITQGEGEFLFDEISFPISVGTLIFGFEGEEFALKQGNEVRYLYIDFNGEKGNTLCHRVGIYPHTRVNDNFDSLIPFCQDCLLRTPPENIDIAGESVLLYVLSRLSSPPSIKNDAIQNIIEFTEKHFRETELSISVIADMFGYNSKYLSHLFKMKTNMNYSEYLRSVRFKYAISLFELGINSVKNVALLSGFSDPLYFSNAFKKQE
jgi:AraC-like DNA-binding protein